jgi:hypothetical protein
LYDVRNCSDLRKNGEGIATLLEEVGVDIMGREDKAEGLAGWVIDNTRANMSAISILASQRPEWVNVRCTAHGVALAMKDFCNFTKTSGHFSTAWGI